VLSRRSRCPRLEWLLMLDEGEAGAIRSAGGSCPIAIREVLAAPAVTVEHSR
jgi:hypothetical protein